MKKNLFAHSIARRLTAGLVVAALLAAPMVASAAPRHAPPPGGRHAPAQYDCHGPSVAPPHDSWHHPAPPPPPHHHHHHDGYCNSDVATDAAVAVGTLALIGLVAAFCAD